jgi:hypothetical protein
VTGLAIGKIFVVCLLWLCKRTTAPNAHLCCNKPVVST